MNRAPMRAFIEAEEAVVLEEDPPAVRDPVPIQLWLERADLERLRVAMRSARARDYKGLFTEAIGLWAAHHGVGWSPTFVANTESHRRQQTPRRRTKRKRGPSEAR